MSCIMENILSCIAYIYRKSEGKQMKSQFGKKDIRRFGSLLCFILLFLSLTACRKRERYQDQFTDVFDTASMVIGYEESEEDS